MRIWLTLLILAAPSATAAAASSPGIGEMPVIELPVKGETPTMALFLSTENGWGGADEAVARGLVEEGVPVVGLDSKRYFATPRSPEGLAADLDYIISSYAVTWKSRTLILIGDGQGADVLPFAYNRLPATSRERVRIMVMAGVSAEALFNLAGNDAATLGNDTAVEVRRVRGVRLLCLYGGDDWTLSACPQLEAASNVQLVKLPAGGGARRAVMEILEAAGLITSSQTLE